MVSCCISWCSSSSLETKWTTSKRSLSLFDNTRRETKQSTPIAWNWTSWQCSSPRKATPNFVAEPVTLLDYCSPLHVWSLVTLHGSRWSAPISTTYAFVYFWNWIWSSKTFWKHSRLPMATQHFQNHNTPKHSKEGFQWPSSTSNSMNTLRQLMWFFFTVTSKTHFAWHSLQFSNCIHPFLIWCYEGESTMRRAQILWKSCLHGSKHWQASKKAAWKERHLMWMQCKG